MRNKKSPSTKTGKANKHSQPKVTHLSPLKQLCEMALEAKRKKYPSIPPHAIPKPKYNDRTANGLTKCIIDFLRLSGWQAERIAVQGRLIDKTQTYTDVVGRSRRVGSTQWIKPSMQPGTADISATIRSRSVKIEVKIKDRQSPAQVSYQQQIEQSGGLYFVAKSFDKFFEWYNNIFGREVGND